MSGGEQEEVLIHQAEDSAAAPARSASERTCHRVQERFSDLLEGTLSCAEEAEVQAHLAHCTDCSCELHEMQYLMNLLRENCVRREPALDLWAEMAPKVEQVMAEQRLGFAERVRLRLSRTANSIAAGAILFTSVLAMNTEARLRKYLLTDPFRQEV